MKWLLMCLVFSASVVQAHPLMTVKERLRISLWTEGVAERPVIRSKVDQKRLPEELERALRKI